MLDAAQIIATTARLFDIPAEDIFMRGRKRHTIPPRQALAYCLHRDGWSQERIGALLGGRDHTTISEHIRRAAMKVAEQPRFADQVRRLTLELGLDDPACRKRRTDAERLALLEARVAQLQIDLEPILIWLQQPERAEFLTLIDTLQRAPDADRKPLLQRLNAICLDAVGESFATLNRNNEWDV